MLKLFLGGVGMNIGEKISELMAKRGTNAKELANKIGVTPSTIYSLIQRGSSRIDVNLLIKIANALGTTADELIAGERKGYIHTTRRVIPVYGRIAAGKPMEMTEDIIGEADITYLPSDHEYIALKINGRSMEPALMDGDIVIVSRQPDVENGEIAVVAVNGGDATCKRVYKYSNGVRLVPINPEFEPIILNKQEIDEIPVRIIGKVVESRHRWV